MICTAHSARTGLPCKRPAIKGGNVCCTHGGSAGQVIAAARRRLADMVDPAINVLNDLMEDKTIPAVRLGAVKDVLDRAGLKPAERLEVSGDLTARILAGRAYARGEIATDVPDSEGEKAETDLPPV